MGLYLKLEKFFLATINWIWKVFIVIHEYKNIFKKRKLFKNQKLTPEQKKSIDDFYQENYGKKIPYWWHRLYTSYTGKFDCQYIPEFIYSTKLELKQNGRLAAFYFENKNMLSVIFGGECKQPETILMCVEGRFFDSNREPISKTAAIDFMNNYTGQVFAKLAVDSNSGRGVSLLDLKKGIDTKSNKEISVIMQEMGKDFVLQKRILPHPAFKKIYPNAINTLRVITYMTKDEIKIAPIVMRIGQGGGVVDNAHAGGMFIGVTNNGELLEEAFTEYQERYTKHPDTGVVFKGYTVPGIPQIRETAIALHKKVPIFQFVSWDFAVDEEGEVVLIEANLHSQAVWISQMAHGKAMFGSDTAWMLKSVR